MKDSEFKNLDHRIGTYRVASRGKVVAKGYKPDITIVDKRGRLTFILECEQKTDRKAFLGDLIKAEKYAEDSHAHPVLVIVMQPESNTTVRQIANHLSIYAEWLSRRNGGALSLAGIQVMSDEEYLAAVQENELLTSKQFGARATVVVQTISPS